MRFMTRETLKAPPTEEVKALFPAETAKGKELIQQGLVEAVYLAADQSGAWIIWNVASEAVLEETHNTLPLHPYLNSEIVSELAEEVAE